MRRAAAIALAIVSSFACSRSSTRARVEESAAVPPASALVPSRDPEEARRRRNELVDSLRTSGWVTSDRVIQAMRAVPRHLFVPTATLEHAYEDRPLPIGHAQTISQPAVVGLMTQALQTVGTERVLEIGTGSGYQAAILSLLCREVYSIEIVRPLGEEARDRLNELGFKNVQVRIGDGYAGWPEHAPFDAILVTAAPPEIPKALLAQLAEGGVLVAPIGPSPGVQRLMRYRKVHGEVTKEDLGSVLFVPMVEGKDAP